MRRRAVAEFSGESGLVRREQRRSSAAPMAVMPGRFLKFVPWSGSAPGTLETERNRSSRAEMSSAAAPSGYGMEARDAEALQPALDRRACARGTPVASVPSSGPGCVSVSQREDLLGRVVAARANHLGEGPLQGSVELEAPLLLEGVGREQVHELDDDHGIVRGLLVVVGDTRWAGSGRAPPREGRSCEGWIPWEPRRKKASRKDCSSGEGWMRSRYSCAAGPRSSAWAGTVTGARPTARERGTGSSWPHGPYCTAAMRIP